MARFKQTIDWTKLGQDVDAATFPPALARLYADYVSKRETANEALATFKEGFVDTARTDGMIAEDETYAFSFNFGKLRVAKIADTGTGRTSNKAPALAFAKAARKR